MFCEKTFVRVNCDCMHFDTGLVGAEPNVLSKVLLEIIVSVTWEYTQHYSVWA